MRKRCPAVPHDGSMSMLETAPSAMKSNCLRQSMPGESGSRCLTVPGQEKKVGHFFAGARVLWNILPYPIGGTVLRSELH